MSIPKSETCTFGEKEAKRMKFSSDAHKPDGTESRPARFCKVHSDGSVVWEADKFQVALDPNERKDDLFLRNLVRGQIVTGDIFPLIFESSEDPTVHLRSLSFFHELDKDPSRYDQLDEAQRMHVNIGVRDLFFADSRGFLNEEEHEIFLRITDMIDSEPLGKLGSLGFGYCPSRYAKSIRFTTELQDMDPEIRSYFARVVEGEQSFFAVFVNNEELSYHNFENILPLDRALNGTSDNVSFELEELTKVAEDLDLFKMKIVGDSVGMLEELRDMNSLHVTPLNASNRGGSRFIFQSAILSNALTKAVRKSGLLQKLGEDKFVSVNSVFRCNKFEAGDAKFESHRDTPYFDRNRAQLSRYTMLLYLTGGTGKPALRVGHVPMESLEAMSCVVFDQSYEHEGQAFEDGSKIFLRTELIFRVPKKSMQKCPQAAALFSSACYMTGQSIFDERLSKYAHDCYERVNALHWGKAATPREPPTFVLKSLPRKQSELLRFMTNGHDYWFPRSMGTIKECAVMAVLDYFNCVIGDQGTFRSLCKSEMRQGDGSTDWIWKQLSAKYSEESKATMKSQTNLKSGEDDKRKDKKIQGSLGEQKKRRGVASFGVTSTNEVKKRQLFEEALGDVPVANSDDESHCCPFHVYEDFCSWKCTDVQDVFQACRDFSENKILRAPVLFLDRVVLIDNDCIIVEGDKIYIREVPQKNEEKPQPINFAACWNDDSYPPCYVDVTEKIRSPWLLLPPITFLESKEGFRLMLDFFKNDWMIDVDADRQIFVPGYLEGYQDIETNRAPFCEAVNPKYNVHDFFSDGIDLGGRERDDDEERESDGDDEDSDDDNF